MRPERMIEIKTTSVMVRVEGGGVGGEIGWIEDVGGVFGHGDYAFGVGGELGGGEGTDADG